MTVPAAPAPGPATPALPLGSTPPGHTAAPTDSGAIPGLADAASPSSGSEGAGRAGADSAPGGSPGAEDGPPAEEERLVLRRGAAAGSVRATRNVRPVPARFVNGGSGRRSTVLVFWLARPGRVVFTVLAEASSCRTLGSFAAPGRAGVNRVRYRGRLDGRRLQPGRYTIVPRVYRPGSVTHLERVAIEILPSSAQTPLWRRAALVPVGCRGNVLAGVWERSTAAGVPSALRRVRSAGVAAAEKTDHAPAATVVEPAERGGVAIEVPFYTRGGGEGGGPSLVAGIVLAAFGLAIMSILAVRTRSPVAAAATMSARAAALAAGTYAPTGWPASRSESVDPPPRPRAASRRVRATALAAATVRRFTRDRTPSRIEVTIYSLAIASAAAVGLLIAFLAAQ